MMEPESEQEGAMLDCSSLEFPAIHKVLSNASVANASSQPYAVLSYGLGYQ